MEGGRTGRRIAAIVAAFALLGALAFIADGAEMRRALAAATGWPVIFALLATAVSSAACSYGFLLVGRLFRLEASGRALFLAGFVSTALGNLFGTALLASLLFRLVYYVVPYALALSFSRRLLRTP